MVQNDGFLGKQGQGMGCSGHPFRDRLLSQGLVFVLGGGFIGAYYY